MNRFLSALIHRVINLHNGSLVTTPVAVVWGREHSHNLPVVLPLVALHYELMRTSNEVETVNVSKLLRDILTERVTSSPR